MARTEKHFLASFRSEAKAFQMIIQNKLGRKPFKPDILGFEAGERSSASPDRECADVRKIEIDAI